MTLTHTGIERLLGNRLDREDPDPDLTLTVHTTGDSLTGSLDLLCGEPAILKVLQTERAERKLIAAAGVSFHPVFLFPSEFCSLRL